MTGRKKCTQRDLLSLVGRLVHASKCVPPGRAFTRRLLDAAHSFQGPSIAQVLCLLCLVTLLALTAEADKTASIVNQYYNNDGNGNFANR
ncbi:hypothetical protein FJT64_019008 [Amphibalanus amphitrite]|uniref:Uncharacterized protein n=1 Tax=Amphibalanus amphitrite TaxID=1232801 RepID=A0A6A4X1A6_AMPAM|nr:hypothetical protein FJT64_019008 [Amphibalanus amphitrite]